VSNVPWDNSSDSALRQMYQDPDITHGSAVPIFNSSAVLPGGIKELTFNSSVDDAAGEAQIAADQQGWFQITNLFKSGSVCGGNLSIHKCSLHHAVVEYNVVLSNGTMSLRSQSWQDDNVLFQTYVLISTYMWKCPNSSNSPARPGVSPPPLLRPRTSHIPGVRPYIGSRGSWPSSTKR
jgi:hypothetical protein